MAQIVVTGVSPAVDGSYDLPTLEALTHGDLRLIKRESGVRAGEIEEAFAAGDSDLLVALTLVALKRSGKEIPAELLWESELGAIDVRVGDEDVPPAQTPDSDASESGQPESSGPSSSEPGEPSQAT